MRQRLILVLIVGVLLVSLAVSLVSPVKREHTDITVTEVILLAEQSRVASIQTEDSLFRVTLDDGTVRLGAVAPGENLWEILERAGKIEDAEGLFSRGARDGRS